MASVTLAVSVAQVDTLSIYQNDHFAPWLRSLIRNSLSHRLRVTHRLDSRDSLLQTGLASYLVLWQSKEKDLNQANSICFVQPQSTLWCWTRRIAKCGPNLISFFRVKEGFYSFKKSKIVARYLLIFKIRFWTRLALAENNDASTMSTHREWYMACLIQKGVRFCCEIFFTILFVVLPLKASIKHTLLAFLSLRWLSSRLSANVMSLSNRPEKQSAKLFSWICPTKFVVY